MAAENLLFVDGFDDAFIIKHDLERILTHSIPPSDGDRQQNTIWSIQQCKV